MIRLVVDEKQLRQQAKEVRTRYESGQPRVFLVLNDLGGLQVYNKRKEFDGIVLAIRDIQGLDFKTELLDLANKRLIESVVIDPV